MTASGVRREKAALSQWVRVPPGDGSSRKHRSNCGGNETVEAFGMRATKYGGSASVQAVTQVNAEQASKRTMRGPT